MKILIIEDDTDASKNLSQGLNEKGFITMVADDGLEGIAMARNNKYDALVVDRMLPGLDGLSLIKQLRESGDGTPILMLTALSEVDDCVEGLEAGADDYLGKPFAFAELIARLRALVKRNTTGHPSTKITMGGLSIDKISREVSRDGQKLMLKPREFELLLYFCENAGETITRQMLLKKVWCLEFDPQTNIVDVHISRLRKKIDKDFRDPLIRTVRGLGYVFGPE